MTKDNLAGKAKKEGDGKNGKDSQRFTFNTSGDSTHLPSLASEAAKNPDYFEALGRFRNSLESYTRGGPRPDSGNNGDGDDEDKKY
jgi:hypothetical protein